MLGHPAHRGPGHRHLARARGSASTPARRRTTCASSPSTASSSTTRSAATAATAGGRRPTQSTRTSLRGVPRPRADKEALDAYLQTVVVLYTEMLQRRRRGALDPARGVAQGLGRSATGRCRLTPEQAGALIEAVRSSSRSREGGGARPDDATGVPYMMQFQAFPLPGGQFGEVTSTLEVAAHPGQAPALRLADRRGRLAHRHPGLDDRAAVASCSPRPAAREDRPRRPRRDAAAGGAQGARRADHRPGRRPPGRRSPATWGVVGVVGAIPFLHEAGLLSFPGFLAWSRWPVPCAAPATPRRRR